LRARGVTILFVSHSTGDVKAIADRVMWLDHGRMMDIGDPERVISKYLAAMVEKDSTYLSLKKPGDRPEGPVTQAPEVVDRIPNVDHRYGDGASWRQLSPGNPGPYHLPLQRHAEGRVHNAAASG